ncbi:MAG: hypothetical protein KA004_05115 [Verrucomicrobiales bacterium]|nr:hypothetical protein [Verrucomicrobiales bacterium]
MSNHADDFGRREFALAFHVEQDPLFPERFKAPVDCFNAEAGVFGELIDACHYFAVASCLQHASVSTMETDDNAELQDTRLDEPGSAGAVSSPELAESPDSGIRLDPDIIDEIINNNIPLKGEEDGAVESAPAPSPEPELPVEDDPEEQEEHESAEGKPFPKNFRLSKVENEKDALALSVFRSARGAITLAEAVAIVAKKAAPDPAPAAEPAADRPLSAKTVAELDAMASDVEAKYLQAYAELDPSAAELNVQLARIIDAKNEARYREAESAREAKIEETQAQQQWESEWNRNRDKAVELYPDAAKEGTPLFERIREIHDAMIANGDPIVSDVRQPLVLAQMAARDLSIAPVTPPRSHQQPAPKAVRPPAAPVRPRPVGGGSAPSVSASHINLREILRSTDELEALTERFLQKA